MPLVSAIVLNTREAKRTVRCVNALLKQTMVRQAHHDTALEIIIVDNHSQDDSIGILRNRFGSHANVRIVENERNRGFGRGNEAGIRIATGTYLLIINPDVTLPPDGLERMVRAMEADPTIGMLGPQLCFQDGTIRRSFRPFPRPLDVFIKRTPLRYIFRKRLSHFLGEHIDASVTQDVDWLAGGCVLMQMDVYRSMGGFDPRFFLFFEDTDLCRRLWNAGKRVVYFPEVKAQDGKKRLSEGGILSIFTKKTVRIHLVSAMRYFWKWRGQGTTVNRP
jgi:N-acetylglucosaminyl-diphospho-decaprenol L-rhamnosyltransferase